MEKMPVFLRQFFAPDAVFVASGVVRLYGRGRFVLIFVGANSVRPFFVSKTTVIPGLTRNLQHLRIIHGIADQVRNDEDVMLNAGGQGRPPLHTPDTKKPRVQ